MKAVTSTFFWTVFMLFSSTINVYVLQCSAYKILILPLVAKSHIFSMTSIGEELASRGHLVHMMLANDIPLTPDLSSNQSRITIIRSGSATSEKSIDYETIFEEVTTKAMETNEDPMKILFPQIIKLLQKEADKMLVGNEQLYEEMENFHYDISIVDSIFFAKYLHLIPHRLGIPSIVYSDVINPWLVPVPWLPSFTIIKVTNYIGTMTFVERLCNAMYTILFHSMNFAPDPPKVIMDKYRSYGPFDSLDELISKSLLFISTLDPVLDDPLPSTPNVIHAGGLTIKPTKSKTLPKEFEDFIDGGKSGVIVVTFGSMAPSLPESIAKKFIATFSRLPDFHVIWRLKNKDDLSLPKNVMIANWLPQNDLLADPRVKLFITHCGNNGQFEAVYHGVPMIGFPLLGDQKHNGKRLEHKGYGVAMNIRDFTTDGLLESIHLVISDEKYKKRVTLASEILKSARRGPAERVGDAVEHVIRFGGDHLRSAGSDLVFYQYLMFDILAFVATVITLIFILICKIGFPLVRKCVGRFIKKQEKRKAA